MSDAPLSVRPVARRMRAYRDLRRRKMHCETIRVTDADVEALRERGYCAIRKSDY